MALGATIYTFDIDLADADRGVYETRVQVYPPTSVTDAPLNQFAELARSTGGVSPLGLSLRTRARRHR